MSQLEHCKFGVLKYPDEEEGFVDADKFFGYKVGPSYFLKIVAVYLGLYATHFEISIQQSKFGGMGQIATVELPLDISSTELGHQIRLALARCNPGRNKFKEKFFPEAGQKYVPRPVDENAEGPVGFGLQVHWLAVKTKDVNGVIHMLDIKDCVETSWEEGLEAVSRSDLKVYVTPPVKGWTFVVSAFLDGIYSEKETGRILCALSRKFGEAQLYCIYAKAVEIRQWAKAENGKLIRWALCNYENGDMKILGKITPEEKKALGFLDKPEDYWSVEPEQVFAIAGEWSLDPSQFSPGDPESVGPGLLGRFSPD